MKKIAVGNLGEFWYGDYKEPFVQLEGAIEGYPQGVVLKDDAGRLLCAYCGVAYDNLGLHAGHRHGLSAREYKREVGLLQKSALVSERQRLKFVGAALRRPRPTPPPPKRALAGGHARKGLRAVEGLNKTGRCHAQVLAVARDIARRYGRVSQPSLSRVGIHANVVERHFGSLAELQRAVGVPVPNQSKAARWSDAQLVLGLRALAVALGRTPSASDLRREGMPSAATFGNRFGSYAAACIKAGLNPNLRPPDGAVEYRLFLAMEVTGNYGKAARAIGISQDRAARILARYGYPYAAAAPTAPRRAWAGDMARRLAGLAKEAAA